MKIIKSRVFITAAIVICLGAAVFFTSTQIAMGAQESAIITQQSTYAAAADSAGDDSQVDPLSASVDIGETKFISEEEALAATLWVAENVFELSLNTSSLEAKFEAAHDLVDENGVVYCSVHDNWQVSNTDFFCFLDASTGEVLWFDARTDDYPGESITEGGFDSLLAENIYDDPGNIYVRAARSIVESVLAGGRVIQDIQVDGIQFAWVESDHGAEATGTVQVDCHVYMDSGSSYTLSFWGTSEVVLKIFNSHPTHHACTWGYFYEEQAGDYPPQSATGEWQTAPGIVDGTYSKDASARVTPAPQPTTVPSS